MVLIAMRPLCYDGWEILSSVRVLFARSPADIIAEAMRVQACANKTPVMTSTAQCQPVVKVETAMSMARTIAG
jgi:hypothetical protein